MSGIIPAESEPVPPKPVAWQPLTPRGVAAFASASTNRLRIVQLVFAAAAGLCVLWFLHRNVAPAANEAIGNLPETTEMTSGILSGVESSSLAGQAFLSLAIDFELSGEWGRESVVQMEFSTNQFQVCSLLGCLECPYGSDWNLDLGRSVLEPKWGAWRPFLLILAGLATTVALLISWTLLAFLYTVPALITAYFLDRELTWRGAWRISGAALLPGSFFLCAGIVLFGAGFIDLVRFATVFAAHFLVGWVVLFLAAFRLPLRPERIAQGRNPFDEKSLPPVPAGLVKQIVSKEDDRSRERRGVGPSSSNPFGDSTAPAPGNGRPDRQKSNPFS